MPATDAPSADVAPARSVTAATASRRPPALPPLPGGRAARPRLASVVSTQPQTPTNRRLRRRSASSFVGSSTGRTAYSSSDDEQLNAAAGAGVQRTAVAVASPPPAPAAQVAAARQELQRFAHLDKAWMEDVESQFEGVAVTSGDEQDGAAHLTVAGTLPSQAPDGTQHLPPWLTPAFLTGLTAVAQQTQQLGGAQRLFGVDAAHSVVSAGNALPSVQAAFHGVEAARLAALERNLGMFESQLAAKERALKDLMADIHTVEAARRSTAEAHAAAQLEAQQAASRHVSASVTAYAARAAADAALLDVLGDDVAVAVPGGGDADSDVFHHELLLADAMQAEQVAARQAAESALAAKQAAALAAEATRLADALAAAAAQEEARALWRAAAAAAQEEVVSDAAVFASDFNDGGSDDGAAWSGASSDEEVEQQLGEDDVASAESAARWLSRLDGVEDTASEGSDEAAMSFDAPAPGIAAAVEGDALDDALLGLTGDDVAQDVVVGDLWAASTQAEMTFVLDFPPEGAPSPGPLFSAASPAAETAVAPPSPPPRTADASPPMSPVSPTQQHSAVAVAATVAALSAALVAAPMVFPELSMTALHTHPIQQPSADAGAAIQSVFDAARVAGDDAYQAALLRLGLAAKQTPLPVPEPPAPVPVSAFVDVPIVAMPPPPPPPAPPALVGASAGAPGGGEGGDAVTTAPAATPAGSAAASLLASLAAQPQALGGALVTLALTGVGAATTRRVLQDEQAKAAAAAEAAARLQAAQARQSSVSRLGLSALAAGLVAASTVAWVQVPSVLGIDMLHLPTVDAPAVSFGALPAGYEDVIDVEATVTSMDGGSDAIAALVTVPPTAPALVDATPIAEAPARARAPTAAPRLSTWDALFSALLATGALTCASVTMRLLREAESDNGDATDEQQLARTEAEFKRRYVAARESLVPLSARVALTSSLGDTAAAPVLSSDDAQVLCDAVSLEAEEEAAAVLTHRMPLKSTGGSTLRSKMTGVAAAASPALGKELTRQEVDAAILGVLRTGWALLQRVAADWTGEAEVGCHSAPVAETTDVAATRSEAVEPEPVSEAAAVLAYAAMSAEVEEPAIEVLPLLSAVALLPEPPADAALLPSNDTLPVWLAPPGMTSPVAASLTAVRRAAREAVAARERMLTTTTHADMVPLLPEQELASMQEPLALLRAAEEAAAAATVLYLSAVTDAPVLTLAEQLESHVVDPAPTHVEEPVVAWVEAPAWDAGRKPSPAAQRLPPVLFTGAQLQGLPVFDVELAPPPVVEAPPPPVVVMEEEAPLDVAQPAAIIAAEVVVATPPPALDGPPPAAVEEMEPPAVMTPQSVAIAIATPVAVNTTPEVVEHPLPVITRHEAAPVTWRAAMQEEDATPPRPMPTPPRPSKHALAAAARAQHKASRRAAAAQSGVPVAWRQAPSPMHAHVDSRGGACDDRAAAHRALKWLARADEQESSGSRDPGSFVLSDGYDGACSASEMEGGRERKKGGQRGSPLDFGGAPPGAR